jgi:hypothetical protein
MKFGRCDGCGVFLLQHGGFAGTSLCGPCCTGEADTAKSITKDCTDCRCLFETDSMMVMRCDNCVVKKRREMGLPDRQRVKSR